MRSLSMPVIAAAPVIVVAAVGFAAPAGAAPAGPTASDTVKSLHDQGFQVIVNKAGNAPLDQCAVSSVRPGQTFERMESDVPGPRGHTGITTIVTGMTVYVDVSC